MGEPCHIFTEVRVELWRMCPETTAEKCIFGKQHAGTSGGAQEKHTQKVGRNTPRRRERSGSSIGSRTMWGEKEEKEPQYVIFITALHS
ncbi:Hypothetical protein SMAX5B_018282 [Scophthalmus maximus]|uniref:Uncharacterized protein n=1 Tax=Scophthalmus maximus TaxID=52904 RepID=A0A2U9C8E6_SCOMX|nr:Hypothetical protein SMAX5B_018282 [Scophthalmus maximus]